MNTFEIFIQGDKITNEDWQGLIDKIRQYDNTFAIEIALGINTIEIYLYSQKNLSPLTTQLGNFLLMPTEKSTDPVEPLMKKASFKLPSNRNFLEIKEKEEIKKGKVIKKVIINFHEILLIRFYVIKIYFLDKKGESFYSSYITFTNPLSNFEFDFKKDIKLKKKSSPLFLKIDDVPTLLGSVKKEGLLEILGFPYFSSSFYLSLKNFEFGKHSLIVGQTGTGKSKLIELFIKEIVKYKLNKEYRIVLIDPHATLYPQLLNIQDTINYDYVRSSCDLFPAFSEPKIATELTILLFKTLLKDQFNAKMERVLKYVIYILFLRNQMSLLALKKFLTELEFRKDILVQLEEGDAYLVHFFDTEYVEMQTKFYETAIMPILVLIDELSFIPAFSKEAANKLETTIKNNFLTCFSLNRMFLGDKATRLIAGLLIQQIFLIVQKQTVAKKIILIIDEVSLVENESMIAILSEARKYNLSLFLSQQYLTQITPDLLKAVMSNVYNYFVFKVSDEDAKILTKNLEIKFPDEILMKEKNKGFSEDSLKRELLVTLNPRECLVRVFAEGKFHPCFKAKTLSI